MSIFKQLNCYRYRFVGSLPEAEEVGVAVPRALGPVDLKEFGQWEADLRRQLLDLLLQRLILQHKKKTRWVLNRHHNRLCYFFFGTWFLFLKGTKTKTCVSKRKSHLT